jgi:hypothetical protein
MLKVGYEAFDLAHVVHAVYTPADSHHGPSKLRLVLGARSPARTQRGAESFIINTNIVLRFSGIEADGVWQKIDDTAEHLPTVDTAPAKG